VLGVYLLNVGHHPCLTRNDCNAFTESVQEWIVFGLLPAASSDSSHEAMNAARSTLAAATERRPRLCRTSCMLVTDLGGPADRCDHVQSALPLGGALGPF
jgi:hypothetical protein